MSQLDGVAVRDFSGREGRVLRVTEDRLRVGWFIPGTMFVVEQTVRREQLEVLTDRGWAPGSSVDVAAIDRTRVRPETQAATGAIALAEATKHYPFTFKANLGPGPRGRKNKEALKWACRCKNYVCQCRGAKGARKTVRIDPEYKSRYNKEYRRWKSGD